jgi:hypothetical protein
MKKKVSIQLNEDADTLKNFIQTGYPLGAYFTDEAFMMAGILSAYEIVREEAARRNELPPHEVEIAYRRIMTECDCAAEVMRRNMNLQ